MKIFFKLFNNNLNNISSIKKEENTLDIINNPISEIIENNDNITQNNDIIEINNNIKEEIWERDEDTLFKISENDDENIKYWKELFNYDIHEFLLEVIDLMRNPNMDDLDPIMTIFEEEKKNFKFWKGLREYLQEDMNQKIQIGGFDKKYKELYQNLINKKNIL